MSHTPMTLYSGPEDCFDRECEEYLTEDGYDNGIELCSHIREKLVCEQCSVECDADCYDPVVAWPCPEASANQTA